MRILFVSSGFLYSEKYPFERGGTQSQIYGIAKEMTRQGHETYILGRFDRLKGKEVETISGVQFINIKTPHLKDEIIYEIGSTLLYSKAAAKRIKQIKPDIMCLTDRFSAYFPSKLEIPKIFVTHNPDAMEFYIDFAIKNNRLNYIFFNVKKRMEESVMSRSNIIVALTKNIENYLHNKGFTNTVQIPNAVNIKKYMNGGEENFILFAGRLVKVKGISYLIQAFSEICNMYDTNLLIVGSGTDENKLKKMVAMKNIKDRVHFIPMVSRNELRNYLSKCSVFVLPSLFETFGIILIEAMASGKPVIASDIPGPKDIITHGIDGFLFKNGDANELKEYLKFCLSDIDRRRQIGKNARKIVEEKYTFEKISMKYMDIFNKLLEVSNIKYESDCRF